MGMSARRTFIHLRLRLTLVIVFFIAHTAVYRLGKTSVLSVFTMMASLNSFLRSRRRSEFCVQFIGEFSWISFQGVLLALVR